MTAALDAVLKGRDTVSDAADRRIAELEMQVGALRMRNGELEKFGEQSIELQHRDLTRIKELEAKLVERDVYEAQQILPPEQAALIKHLATVERCIEEGRYDVDGMDPDDMYCGFCARIEGHDKTCAWLALQFDRKPAETMAMVEGWAWEENARRDRDRARAMTPRRLQGPALTMMGLNEMLKNTWPAPVQEVYAENPLLNSIRGHMHVQASPFVPPGTAYVFQPGALPEGSRIVSMTHDSMTVDVPVTAVAPPDDEDVP